MLLARLFALSLSLVVVGVGGPARAQSGTEPKPGDGQASPPDSGSTKPAVAAQPAVDPFARLHVRVPREKLSPLASVRVRDKREQEERSRKGNITVSVGSSPKGASVYYGRKLLGSTPLTLTAQRGSTPMDVVLRRAGYMTLRTRLMRRVSRGYYFKLTPAKLR